MTVSGDPPTLLAGIFILSLFADSAATIVAALLVAQGLLPAGVTALAVPLFLIVGDGALYLFGALAGNNILLRRFVPTRHIARAAAWLQDRRTLVLALARALPGSRTIVFVGFGYLRMPVVHFFVVNSIGATLWSLTLMLLVTLSAGWFEKTGPLASLAAGLVAAMLMLLPAFLLARRSDLRDVLVKQKDD
ncbi:DedA family protein [Kordiimonas aestuarii]|uniref:DedA family protein n=1 Tax=Kordiimonas aestuarii TaxID=1005925 RepID=UPI0021D118FB|nr:VTT domain-containing protein [Kordiimonas aestuarii]